MKKRQIYYRRMLAALLFGVFSFAVTPKQFLHHFFAKHIDARVYSSVKASNNLNASGFHCNCNDLVAEMPFEVIPVTGIVSYICPSRHTGSVEIKFKSFSPFQLSDRGPPKLL